MKKLIGLVLAGFTLASTGWVWYATRAEGLVVDNAFVSSRVLNIVARNDGLISGIRLVRGQSVNKGQILMYAGLTENELQMNAIAEQLKESINDEVKACKEQFILQFELDRASQQLRYARGELQRSEQLVASSFISAQALEQKRSQTAQALASVNIAVSELGKSLTTNKTPLLDRPKVKQLINELKRTFYNWYEAKVISPFDGYIYDVRTYEGKYVEKGENLVVLIPRESQLVRLLAGLTLSV